MLQPPTMLLPDFFEEVDRSSPVPLYFQVAARLERAIRDGELPAGSRLENEVSIGRRFGLSRHTLRHAIQETVDRGLLVRRRGIGTEVVHPPVTRRIALTGLFEDLSHGGRRPTTTVLECDIRRADSSTAAALRIDEGDDVVELRRVRYADGAPVAILQNTLRAGALEPNMHDLRRQGLYEMLKARGADLCAAEQRIGARVSTDEEAELLGLTRAETVLTMSRTTFDGAGRAIDFGRHCYSPHRHSFALTVVAR